MRGVWRDRIYVKHINKNHRENYYSGRDNHGQQYSVACHSSITLEDTFDDTFILLQTCGRIHCSRSITPYCIRQQSRHPSTRCQRRVTRSSDYLLCVIFLCKGTFRFPVHYGYISSSWTPRVSNYLLITHSLQISASV